jgi:hypothetical protein
VVVLFTLHAQKVLLAANRQRVAGMFAWVASDALVPNVEDLDGCEEVSGPGMVAYGQARQRHGKSL